MGSLINQSFGTLSQVLVNPVTYLLHREPNSLFEYISHCVQLLQGRSTLLHCGLLSNVQAAAEKHEFPIETILIRETLI